MSKLVKIYDGMTFDMSTGEVLSHGDVTYHAEEDIAQCGGGGPSTQTTTLDARYQLKVLHNLV